MTRYRNSFRSTHPARCTSESLQSCVVRPFPFDTYIPPSSCCRVRHRCRLSPYSRSQRMDLPAFRVCSRGQLGLSAGGNSSSIHASVRRGGCDRHPGGVVDKLLCLLFSRRSRACHIRRNHFRAGAVSRVSICHAQARIKHIAFKSHRRQTVVAHPALFRCKPGIAPGMDRIERRHGEARRALSSDVYRRSERNAHSYLYAQAWPLARHGSARIGPAHMAMTPHGGIYTHRIHPAFTRSYAPPKLFRVRALTPDALSRRLSTPLMDARRIKLRRPAVMQGDAPFSYALSGPPHHARFGCSGRAFPWIDRNILLSR